MRVTFWYPNEAAGAKRAREEAALSNPPSSLLSGSVSCPFRFRVVTDFSGAENAEREVQESAKRWSPGWVNFVAALAYHFCLALAVTFTQPGDHLLVEPCMSTGIFPWAPLKRLSPFLLRSRMTNGAAYDSCEFGHADGAKELASSASLCFYQGFYTKYWI